MQGLNLEGFPDSIGGVPLISPKFLFEADDYLFDLLYSYCGQALVATTTSGLLLWIENQKTQSHPSAHQPGGIHLDWSSQKVLASAGHDGQICLWREGRRVSRQTDLGNSWINKIKFSPSGKQLAVIQGKELKLYDIEDDYSLRLAQKFQSQTSTLTDLAWNSRGSRIYTCSYGGLQIWYPRDESPRKKLAWKGSLLRLSLSPDEKWVCCGAQDSSVHLWNLNSLDDLEMSGYSVKVRELSWHFKSQWFATGGGREILLWNFSGKGPGGTTPQILSGHAELVSALAFQKEGDLLASLGEDGALLIWNITQTLKPLSLGLIPSSGTALHWNPQKPEIAVGYESGHIAIWPTDSVSYKIA